MIGPEFLLLFRLHFFTQEYIYTFCIMITVFLKTICVRNFCFVVYFILAKMLFVVKYFEILLTFKQFMASAWLKLRYIGHLLLYFIYAKHSFKIDFIIAALTTILNLLKFIRKTQRVNKMFLSRPEMIQIQKLCYCFVHPIDLCMRKNTGFFYNQDGNKI